MKRGKEEERKTISEGDAIGVPFIRIFKVIGNAKHSCTRDIFVHDWGKIYRRWMFVLARSRYRKPPAHLARSLVTKSTRMLRSVSCFFCLAEWMWRLGVKWNVYGSAYGHCNEGEKGNGVLRRCVLWCVDRLGSKAVKIIPAAESWINDTAHIFVRIL